MEQIYHNIKFTKNRVNIPEYFNYQVYEYHPLNNLQHNSLMAILLFCKDIFSPVKSLNDETKKWIKAEFC